MLSIWREKPAAQRRGNENNLCAVNWLVIGKWNRLLVNTFVVEMDQLDGKLIQSASCWLLFIFAAVQIVMYTLFIKTFSSKNTRSGLNRMPSVDFSQIPRGRRKSNLIFAGRYFTQSLWHSCYAVKRWQPFHMEKRKTNLFPINTDAQFCWRAKKLSLPLCCCGPSNVCDAKSTEHTRTFANMGYHYISWK